MQSELQFALQFASTRQWEVALVTSYLSVTEASTCKFWFDFGDWSMFAQLRDCTQKEDGGTCKVWFSWFGSVGWLIEVFEHSYRSADKGGMEAHAKWIISTAQLTRGNQQSVIAKQIQTEQVLQKPTFE